MPPEPCLQCGSTSTYSEDGPRLLQPLRATFQRLVPTEEDNEFGRQGKSTRLKKDKTKVKASKVFKGKKAYRLFLQAWGFLLWRKCVYVLVKERGVPGELWGVVRDLWGGEDQSVEWEV